MDKFVYVVMKCNTYDEWETEGICSTEEKANAVKEALLRNDCEVADVRVKAILVDHVVEKIAQDLEDEIKRSDDAKRLLEQLRSS